MDSVLDESTSALVSSLNELLASLDIPIGLTSPLDLTPTLLLAILESTLESRLPLPPGVRDAHTPQTKVEAIKIFLGVLANDILGVDLSQVDPRKLARGEWDECVYVGGLLVHVAKKEGLMGDDEAIVDIDPEVSVSEALEEGGITEGLPRVLQWSTPPPSTTRGRSETGSPVAGMATTRAGSTTAVGEGRSLNGGGAARILAMMEDRHGAVTSTPRTQRTGALGSRSFMAYKPASSRSTRRPSAHRSVPAPTPSTPSSTRVEYQRNSPEGGSPDECRTPAVRESGWLRYIEDEDSVPVIRHILPPTFRNQVPSTRVDQECELATRQPAKKSPCLPPEERRLYLLEEKARLLDELAKLELHPG